MHHAMNTTTAEFPYDITNAVPVTITKSTWYKMPSLLRVTIDGKKYTIRFEPGKGTIVYAVTLIGKTYR